MLAAEYSSFAAAAHIKSTVAHFFQPCQIRLADSHIPASKLPFQIYYQPVQLIPDEPQTQRLKFTQNLFGKHKINPINFRAAARHIARHKLF